MIGSSVRASRRRGLVPVVALGLAAALTLTSCSGHSASATPAPSGLNSNQATGTFMGFGMTPPQPRPHFTLTDTSGKPYEFNAETSGDPTFLYFGYTNCPDVCPATMADIGNAIRKVPAAIRDKTKVVFVTTDVKRDTEAVLKGYLALLDPDLPNKFVGLTGTQQQIDTAQTVAGVTLAEDDGQTHSAKVLLFGADDYARVAFEQSDNEQQAMTHDLPLIAK